MLHWLYAPENRAKAVEVTAAFTKSSAAVLDTYFLKKNNDYYRDPNGCISAKNVQPAIDAMTKEGFLPGAVDMVNVFRRPHRVPDHIDDILAKKPKSVWMQLGIRNDEAAERFARAGISVVQDRCLMVELRQRGL